MDEPAIPPPRSQARRFVASIVVGAATAQALGLALSFPTQFGANDISRWCTVWSLLERGTYAIDDCPWQSRTQDKVYRAAPFAGGSEGGEPPMHFYSSKPPLLPTLIAGILYPVRAITGVPLHRTIEQERSPRYVQKARPDAPGAFESVLETPKDPVKWPAYVLYLKPIVLLLNVVPLCLFLIYYARFLDQYAENDWAWFLSLFAAAWGTQLFAFGETLNNHSVAAFSAFFAIYPLVRIWHDGERGGRYFVLAGFFGAFCACNELPAALFGIALFGILLARAPRQTLLWFVPAAAIPCAAFLATQYLAFGQFWPVYDEFGTKSYHYPGSVWNTPLEMDWLNEKPESKAVYLFHMALGHHGIVSLTPIILFSAYAVFEHLRGRMRRLTPLAWLTAFLTIAMLAFYDWNPKARNYGGSTQGLRWLFWLFPFWLTMLPPGLEPGQDRPWFRRLSLAALFVSILSVGYALRNPWSHPWLLDGMEHLGLYHLKR